MILRWARRFLDPADVVIEVVDGAPAIVRGSLPPRRYHPLYDVLVDAELASGTVRVVRRGKKFLLECSEDVPAGVQQRLRNAWVAGA